MKVYEFTFVDESTYQVEANVAQEALDILRELRYTGEIDRHLEAVKVEVIKKEIE